MFETANAGFAQIMYEEYLRDPAAVSEEWRQYFQAGAAGLGADEDGSDQHPSVERSGGQMVSDGAGPRNGASGQAELTTRPPDQPTAPTSPAAPAGAVPITGPAARLVANMNDSRSLPTATSFRDLAVSVLEGRRRELNNALRAAGRPEKVSFTHLIGWAIAKSAHSHPALTTVFVDVNGAPHKVPGGRVNLGIAVDVERKDGSRGLVVPVIHDAAAGDFARFHGVYEGLVEKARANKLMPDAFAGATMTLTNPGGLGTVASVPRLMPGQGSIIAVGSIGYPPAFSDLSDDKLRELGIAKTMTITSTYDHRVIQGAESGEFLRSVDNLLQGAEHFYEDVFASLGLKASAAPESAAPARAARPGSAPVKESQAEILHVAAAMALIKAHRTHGHLAAHLDPLGTVPQGDPALDPAPLGLTPESMATIPSSVLRISAPGDTLAEALPKLQEAYCGTMAYELEHIANHQERVWLRHMIESGAHRQPLSPEDQQWLYGRLVQVEAMEKFLHKAYLGQKRFSIEGVDMLVPMLDQIIEQASQQGAREVVIGMAHRGRLNVLAHTVGRPYEAIFAEFEGGRHVEAGQLTPDGGTGDVKYHHGAEGAYKTRSGKVLTVTLSPNPSHLEFVGPVVDGRARAEQTTRKGREPHHDATVAVPVIIHGDAAFAGQGVVAETFNLGALKGYRTGGTVHIITNNQVGFTTDMGDARSTRHASDMAKGFDVPIIHVNADDAEACLSAVRLAMMYRDKFHEDVLIDLVGYRRHGHNEGDEPNYTQPQMYERIRALPTVREQYAALLNQRGVSDAAATEQQYTSGYQKLVDIQQSFKASTGRATPQEPKPSDRSSGVEPETAVTGELLTALNDQLLTWPEGFKVNPKLLKQLERRRNVMGPEGGIDWAHAEALALSSLLVEGIPIRFTGQDVERGTFSQRHLVLHDAETGKTHTPIQNLPGAMSCMELHNSPLSELACLGFEYGYSAAAPETLVIWEAQFGDFVNGAQIIIDQFMVAGLSKWGLTTRLTLLLPHGYEGQGPEHSSAKLERFLQLCAEGNIRVANPTTPAQYFHLLRRQAKRTRQRPLVVMTPKSLLRHKLAVSSLEDFTRGGFHRIIDDAEASDPESVRRVVLCSGKIYYDLLAAAAGTDRSRTALVRMEQLYTFPDEELKQILLGYPNLGEIVWAQEEPRNMGAWTYLEPKLIALLGNAGMLRYVGRPERASPAEGYPAAHQAEQKRIVEEALR
ncbi:MAG TPA: multifunctional oxoglutarate decarboxylase/oxoglutarate dehydrogenase thiamine pyrophosphate-binding subunit/dihydrolipoyllysine-residue succinyltransferase subunit [Gemmatimonadales bacterium]|nr:multifunctional oxoglutarate decarboxylase/oxoglutarate dehydrogenase thiamine pyrophosphate-binding subunit/dihydrolipoyllysine-residue succinyltransferase subunit [Gemmatimonadales bacterium]